MSANSTGEGPMEVFMIERADNLVLVDGVNIRLASGAGRVVLRALVDIESGETALLLWDCEMGRVRGFVMPLDVELKKLVAGARKIAGANTILVEV